MGFGGFGGIVKSVSKAFGGVSKFFGNMNPLVSLGVSLFLTWVLRPKVPDMPDFGTNSFDDFERGLLINKQSNDANIPVIYGERLTGGTRVFMETSGTDNTYLYMSIVMSEGEINDITEIRVDDKVVTWASALSDGTEVEVNSSDTNFYKDSTSLIRIEPHYGTDGQSASTLLSTLTNWGSNHKLSGLCYLAIRFKWNQDAFTGVPKVQAKIQGKKVVAYTEGTVATTTLSANITATQDYIPVASTTNFSTSVVAEIESTNEVVSFTDISENQFTNSENFTTWISPESTVTANTTVAPDGTTTADTLTFTTTGYGSVFKSETVVAGQPYTFSVFAKAGVTNILSLEQRRGNTPSGASPVQFNLTTGTVIASGDADSTSITDEGNGWFRCSMTTNSSPDTSELFIIGRGFSGSVSDTIFIWGAQLEKALTTTTYLPTTSSALVGLTGVTRGVNGTTAQAASSGQTVLQESLSAQTAAYSTNPAWCLLDYLTNERYGKGLAVSEIDLQSFYDASQVCETQVTPYSGGSDINIFDINTAIDTSQNIIDNVREFLKGCRGYLPYTQGKYSLIIETTGTASITLNEDDIIGGYTLSIPSKNERFNRVICSFVDPSRNYQVNEVQFPPIDDSGLPSADQHATMKTVDGGFLLEGRFDFKTITSQYQAEEMAEVILRRSREALTLGITVSFDAYDLAIADIVNISHSSIGFSSKPFRIMGITFNEDFTIGLSLVEHQDSHYTWATKVQATTVPSTNLPNPFTIQPPASVTLDDTLIEYNDGTVIVALDVTIGASPDNFVDYYQVEYKLSTDSNYIIYAQGSGLNHRVLNVIDQSVYDVRVKAVNSLGVSSTYISAQRTIIGAIAPPSDVEDFSCNIVGQEAHLSWNQIPDLDLAYYQLRFSEEIDGSADWQNSVNLVSKVSRPATSISVPARAGTYLIKAVDKLGNFSSNATAIISNVTDVVNHNAVASQSEHPDFLGTLTNTVIADDSIRLDSSELFDSGSGLFDDETTRFFDSGVSNADFFATGNYEFADVIDIGAKHTARITASLTQSSDNPDDLFDNRTGLFDTASSNFDGDTPANCDAHLEIATSDDNITYTAFQNFVIGNYTARYFKFRVFLTSRDLASTPVVSQVSVTIDMPDRIFSGNDITSGAGTYTITFTNPFKSVNYAVGITGEDLATGDFFLVENKTISGFDLTFKNSGGTAISRTFDYIAKGF